MVKRKKYKRTNNDLQNIKFYTSGTGTAYPSGAPEFTLGSENVWMLVLYVSEVNKMTKHNVSGTR
jgi:hypothetical protein